MENRIGIKHECNGKTEVGRPFGVPTRYAVQFGPAAVLPHSRPQRFA